MEGAEEMYQNELTLNNGVKIPQLGLGTWFIDDDKAADAVKAAVKLGYCLLYTSPSPRDA